MSSTSLSLFHIASLHQRLPYPRCHQSLHVPSGSHAASALKMQPVQVHSPWNQAPANVTLSSWYLMHPIKNLPANAGDTRDTGSIPGSGGAPGGRNGNPLQYSCLENPMDRGAWWATVHGVAKSWTQLSRHTHTRTLFYSIQNFSRSFAFKSPGLRVTGSLAKQTP